MNDQPQMINKPPQMMMNPMHPHNMNQSHQLMSAAAAAHSQARNQLGAVQSQPMSSGPQMMNQPPPAMLNRSYMPPWNSQDSNPNANKKFTSYNRNNNWKGKNVKDTRPLPFGSVTAASGSTQGYNPPSLNELQSHNRLNARKFYGNSKKKFNNNKKNKNRFAPYAPRNTTSFIIRAKKSGGVASLVSPCLVTPAVLPTPIFSPSKELLGDMAKEEWGVDGYGSMKGLIRLRSLEVDGDGGSSSESESDVEEHVEVERRLDHDLSRFEMIYPSYGGDYSNLLENRVDDQDTHIAQLEEENLTLKEKLFLMERELRDLTRRMQLLERRSRVAEDINEEVVENESDNESEGTGSDFRVLAGGSDHNNVEMAVFSVGNSRDADVAMEADNNSGLPQNEGSKDVCMDEIAVEDDGAREDKLKNEGRGDDDLKGQFLREGTLQDKAECSEFVKKIVEEEKDELRFEESRNEPDDNKE